MRHVQRGQIHQFKRAELEADLVFQYAVNGGEVGDALRHDAQRLGAVAAPGVVDDEARCVLCAHRLVAHSLNKCTQALTHGFSGGQTRNDFDHFHQGHGIEKMQTNEA